MAVQIEEEAKEIGKYLDFRIGSFYGGVGYHQQEKLLKDGVDVIVGTPGRLIDFNQQKKLKLHDISMFVIDEADRLLDMGFLPDIRKIIRNMPSIEERQTMLFSATLDMRVKNIAYEYMNDPIEIDIAAEQVTVEKVSQTVYHVARAEKMSLLLGLLKRDNPGSAIVFTNTKHMAMRVSDTLRANSFDCHYLTGDLPQKKRQKIIDDLKNGKISFLVATDVASRGLHVDDLELVVNYDLPENSENYVHRIGRTARVGKSGIAISLVCEQFVYELENIETYTNLKIPVTFAEDELFVKVKRATTSSGQGQRKSQGQRQGQGQRKSQGQRGRQSQKQQGSQKRSNSYNTSTAKKKTETKNKNYESKKIESKKQKQIRKEKNQQKIERIKNSSIIRKQIIPVPRTTRKPIRTIP